MSTEADSLDPRHFPFRSLRDTIGRYDTIGEPVSGCCDCLDCGSVVRDRLLHDEWHARLERRASGDGQEEPTRFHGASPSGVAPSDRLPEPTPGPNRNVSDGQDWSGQNLS